MYYSRTQFKARANSKLEANGITGGDITKEELQELYKAWLLSPATSFKEFFNSFCFMTTDDLFDTFEIDSRMYDEFNWREICEYLAKEERDIAGAMQLSDDLFLVIA